MQPASTISCARRRLIQQWRPCSWLLVRESPSSPPCAQLRPCLTQTLQGTLGLQACDMFGLLQVLSWP